MNRDQVEKTLMKVREYFKSLTQELEALKGRVRYFIDDGHWQTDGEWKESVLRSILAQRLPETVKIGRGFVLTKRGPTTQCDILLYKASSPVLFRQSDLVILPPDAVLGVIEVKTCVGSRVLKSVLSRFAEIGQKLGKDRAHCFFGLFCYEISVKHPKVLFDKLNSHITHEDGVVEILSLGQDTFVKWWKHPPRGGIDRPYDRWHAYQLKGLSAGYFIGNH